MHRIRTLIVAALWLACQSAQAQWQWLDKDGRKVFSDRAPPAEIPANNILKRPSIAAPAAPATPAAPPPVDRPSATVAPNKGSAATAKALPLDPHDEELEPIRRRANAAKAAQTKADAERVAAAKARNCEQARKKQELMDSGVRISITNAKGEREILDDAARAAEIKRIGTIAQANCN